MKPVSNMSMQEAQAFVESLGASCLEGADLRFQPVPDAASPDHIQTEKIGRVPRHWTVIVNWKSEQGTLMDAPSVIRVDLMSQTATWD